MRYVKSYNILGIALWVCAVAAVVAAVTTMSEVLFLQATVFAFWADVTGPVVQHFRINEENELEEID